MDPKDLDLSGVIAFDGIIRNGLRLHPDKQNFVYPMGNKIVIRNVKSAVQEFLSGHKNIVTATCVSSCGSLIASGQLNHYGFKAAVIVWDYKERKVKNSYEIHKVRVEDLCFTCDSNYLISLGGRDDGCLVVWDIENGVPLCASYASSEITGDAYALCATKSHANSFLTAGEGTFKVWNIDVEKRKLFNVDVKLGKLRRTINCMAIDEKDEMVYCGTTTGDIIKARLHFSENPRSPKPSVMIGCYSRISQKSKKPGTFGEGDLYSAGVRNIVLLPGEKIVVGAGDGNVELIEIADHLLKNPKMSKVAIQPVIVTRRSVNVCSGVTSMNVHKDRYIFVGTTLCEIYEIDVTNFDVRTIITCHTDSVRDLAFPRNSSDIFVTASKNDIRLWKLDTRRELLRIAIPNFVCTNLCFDSPGQLIISAWNDGTIRGFSLAGGKLVFEIHNAHTKPVSAIALTHDDTKLFSGGCDGQIRIWDAKTVSRRLLGAMKEHRAPITCLRVSRDDKYLISSSTDCTCVLWDVMTLARKHVLMGNTMFMAAAFIPSGVQVLTCGTDRKIAYWETWDGSLAREIEGSSGTINCIDVSPSGRYFVTGSNDCLIKLWEYRTAIIIRIAVAHAAPITACTFSPNGRSIVTVSADGAIMIWEFPRDIEDTFEVEDTVEIEEKDSKCSTPKASQVLPPALEEVPKESECVCAEEGLKGSECSSPKESRGSVCASSKGSKRSAGSNSKGSKGSIRSASKVLHKSSKHSDCASSKVSVQCMCQNGSKDNRIRNKCDCKPEVNNP